MDIRLKVIPINIPENVEFASQYFEKRHEHELPRAVTPLVVVNGKKVYVGYKEDMKEELEKILSEFL